MARCPQQRGFCCTQSAPAACPECTLFPQLPAENITTYSYILTENWVVTSDEVLPEF